MINDLIKVTAKEYAQHHGISESHARKTLADNAVKRFKRKIRNNSMHQSTIAIAYQVPASLME